MDGQDLSSPKEAGAADEPFRFASEVRMMHEALQAGLSKNVQENVRPTSWRASQERLASRDFLLFPLLKLANWPFVFLLFRYSFCRRLVARSTWTSYRTVTGGG